MNEVQKQNNKVMLMGTVYSKPVYSHELYGEVFYDFFLSVPRLSGNNDVLPITVSERLLLDVTLTEGVKVGIIGQFRSYNKIVEEKSKLMLTVFVKEFIEYNEDEYVPNFVEICGFVCKPTVYRTTPFDRKICDILMAVNRGYNKSDYIPCIAWGRNAIFVKNVSVGANLTVTGRIQSRKYVKNLENGESEERVAYELSVNKVCLIDPMKETAASVDDSVN